MLIKSLTLCDFRLYDEAKIELNPKINSIIGPNAQGKTTILEAIYLLINGQSFRTRQPEELVRYGQSAYSINAHFTKHGIDQTLQMVYDGKKKAVYHNGNKLQSLLHLLGILQGVVMTPDHMQLVKGAPQGRRQFLDLLLAQVDPLYIYHLSRYMKALQQRNALLRSKSSSTLDLWEIDMAASGSFITERREKILHEIKEHAKNFYFELAKEPLSLDLIYKTVGQAKSPSEFAAQFERHRKKEMDAGCTFTGPHRDDFLIEIGQKEARSFASEGQKYSLVTSLVLAKWQVMADFIDLPPLLLIDDVGVGLDSARSGRLRALLEGFGQVVITSTSQW